MNIAILCGSLFAICVSLFLSVPLARFKTKEGRQYDMLSDFPFELRMTKNGKSNAAPIFFGPVLLSMVSWPFLQLAYAGESFTLRSLTLASLAALIGFAISAFLLFLVNPANEKEHTLAFVLTGAFLAFSSGVEGFCIFKNLEGFWASAFEGIRIGVIATGAISLLVTALCLLILVNPKLKDWPRLNIIAEKDGTTSYKRPRPFVLACSEWALILLGFAYAASAFVFNIFVASAM